VPPDSNLPFGGRTIELVGGEPNGMQKINKAVRLRRSAARKAQASE
jgi:hypothetical protein